MDAVYTTAAPLTNSGNPASQLTYLCENPGPTYVSAGEEALPAVLGAMGVVYAAIPAFWITLLLWKRSVTWTEGWLGVGG